MGTVRITDIKLTKKGRYALFCGEAFLFSVDELTLLNHRIQIGCELDDDALALARRDSDYYKAYTKALDFLAIRDHSEKELRDKLMRKFDEHTAQMAIDKMRELHYICDESFAQKYAAELIEKKGASKREAQQKLWQKGMARETIESALSVYDDDEAVQIQALIEKKYSTKLAEKNGTKKVFGALLRRGFTARDVRAAFRDLNIDWEAYGEEV